MESPLTARVLVAGAGITGGACAATLRSRGIDVVVREAAQVPGGRMATRSLGGRGVDVGAAYFTVSDPEFASIVDGWVARGMARPWTDTFTVFDPSGRSQRTGPQRWVARDGLRSLVAELHTMPIEFDTTTDISAQGFDAVVLAMPDPQAARVAGDVVDWIDYDPVVAVTAGWGRRHWDLPAAAFVNDDPNVTLIVDDGSRHGDAAPVLVIHTTSELARRHLDDPDAAIAPALDSVRRLLGIDDAPRWTDATLWREAKPSGSHGDAPFALIGSLGVCGDSWCPSGSPRIESAWLSGHRLGAALARRLG